MTGKFIYNQSIPMSEPIFLEEESTIYDYIKLFCQRQQSLRSFPYQEEAERARLILLTAVIIDNDATVKVLPEDEKTINLQISFLSVERLVNFASTLDRLSQAKILF